MRWAEWMASLLATGGVWLIAYGVPDEIWTACVGTASLTIGVRLAIDCGKQGDS